MDDETVPLLAPQEHVSDQQTSVANGFKWYIKRLRLILRYLNISRGYLCSDCYEHARYFSDKPLQQSDFGYLDDWRTSQVDEKGLLSRTCVLCRLFGGFSGRRMIPTSRPAGGTAALRNIPGLLVLGTNPQGAAPGEPLMREIIETPQTTSRLRLVDLAAEFRRYEQPLSDASSLPEQFIGLEVDENKALYHSNLKVIPIHDHEASLKDHHARRVKPTVVDYKLIKALIDNCITSHQGCALSQNDNHTAPNIRLIDCFTGDIITKPAAGSYLTLSYVWGKKSPEKSTGKVDIKRCPRTIADAMHVTKCLGYQYLWVDWYCIDQEDEAAKMEQIKIMDEIYENGVVTIVSIGEHADTGLPGAGTRPLIRREPQRTARVGKRTLTTLPDLERILKGNEGSEACNAWMKRGWTYQEAVLSTRCLFFTPSEAFLVCRSATASESLPRRPRHLQGPLTPENILTLLTQVRRTASGPLGNTRGGGPPDPNTKPLDSMLAHVNQYIGRDLTYDSDAVNAFRSVLVRLRFRTLWGVPLVYFAGLRSLGMENLRSVAEEQEAEDASQSGGGNSNSNSNSAPARDDDTASSVGQICDDHALLNGMCWFSLLQYRLMRRRAGVPTWSSLSMHKTMVDLWVGEMGDPRPGIDWVLAAATRVWICTEEEPGGTGGGEPLSWATVTEVLERSNPDVVLPESSRLLKLRTPTADISHWMMDFQQPKMYLQGRMHKVLWVLLKDREGNYAFSMPMVVDEVNSLELGESLENFWYAWGTGYERTYQQHIAQPVSDWKLAELADQGFMGRWEPNTFGSYKKLYLVLKKSGTRWRRIGCVAESDFNFCPPEVFKSTETLVIE